MRPLEAAADCPGFFPPVLEVLFGSFDFPGRGNFVPSLRSILLMIWGFGTAFPDSYSATTCGFSLMAVASSFWVIFLAVRACIIALLRDLSTLAMVPTSVASSSCFVSFRIEFVSDRISVPIHSPNVNVVRTMIEKLPVFVRQCEYHFGNK